MMDKKSANGFSPKAGEGGVQRKQLPYSVETPYGFHLDLDFLKYVDDIEKGNTIKRVHIQRRVKGPKFSTLPRNFSLPGHGARPALKEKDIAWSGTSTLGPKPKSRVTEVQQIFDFRPSDGATSSQSSRGTTSLASGYVSTKPREEIGAGLRGLEDKPLGLQSRPNLLRASSMPITVQHRKGSDSSSPDQVVGTPENGSSENVFRSSPDLPDRRCVPQDRAGLHQQITVALKRVRELEEQVRTIPELKAQICSLREEREQLILQLQAQAKALTSSSISVPSDDSRAHTEPRGDGPPGELSTVIIVQPERGLDASGCTPAALTPLKQSETESRVLQIERQPQRVSVKSPLAQGEMSSLSGKERERQAHPPEKPDRQIAGLGNPLIEQAASKLSQEITTQEIIQLKVTINETEVVNNQGAQLMKDGKLGGGITNDGELNSVQQLQEKLAILEASLTKASQELERTNVLLKEQIEENQKKDERILQLSEGVQVEVCTTERQGRMRRESIDRGTEMEHVDYDNQETETESPGTVDQGTDTDQICIEVCIPRERAGSIDQETETERVDTLDQVTDTEAETVPPTRQRTNSVDQGTETERVGTHDQMTEMASADRVNQVTETEGETVTNHPLRPRASGVNQVTETDRVDTVDRVTETEAAQRADRQTETETVRDERQNDNPVQKKEAENLFYESGESETIKDSDAVVSVRPEGGNYQILDKDKDDSKNAVTEESVKESSVAITESVDKKSLITDNEVTLESDVTGRTKDTGSKMEHSSLKSHIKTRGIMPPNTLMMNIVNKEENGLNTLEQQHTVADSDVLSATQETLVTESVVVVAVKSAVNAATPVRPQRGRKPAAEQPQSSQPQTTPPQPQAPPLRPRRGSSETQPLQPECQTPAHPQVQVKASSQLKSQTASQPLSAISSGNQIQSSEPKTSPQVQAQSQADFLPTPHKPSGGFVEGQLQPKPQAQKQATSKGSSEVQNQPQPQTSVSRRDSKEMQTSRRRSTESQPLRRGSGEAEASARCGLSEVQAQPQRPRRGSSDTAAIRRGSGESQTVRRASGETAQHRSSTEAQSSRRESGEAQTSRRGSGESPTSPAALGQVVTRLTGLLGEQWAQLGSGSGAQQVPTSQQEGPSAQKQAAGKRAVPVKGASAKPAGKAASAQATTKPAGKAGPSKMSSIQSQLVSSLSVLSAFYSPGQKAAAANKQQEQGLKSIMKKNGAADKQGTGGAKKNLKFVGVNGGYESTSSDSSGDEKTRKTKKEEQEEEDSSEPEQEQEKENETPPAEVEPQEGAGPGAEAAEAQTGAGGPAVGSVESAARQLGLEGDLEFQDVQSTGGLVDQGFVDACIYVKDRMGEVSSPDKEMRQVLLVLYQEWFRVSSQKDSQADTVTLYLRQVGRTTPTLLPYVVNLTDGNGNTALHYSVSHSNFPVVKLLLDTGLCETDNVNKAGYTAVMLAALTAAESPDDLEVALQLLRQGNVDARSSQAGQTALMLAVSHGRVAMVKLLLSCGADVDAQDRDGSTALMCACEHGHTHVVRLLLESGRCHAGLTDKDGQTALSVATGASHQDIMDLLKAHAEARPSSSSSSSSATAYPH